MIDDEGEWRRALHSQTETQREITRQTSASHNGRSGFSEAADEKPENPVWED